MLQINYFQLLVPGSSSIAQLMDFEIGKFTSHLYLGLKNAAGIREASCSDILGLSAFPGFGTENAKIGTVVYPY